MAKKNRRERALARSDAQCANRVRSHLIDVDISQAQLLERASRAGAAKAPGELKIAARASATPSPTPTETPNPARAPLDGPPARRSRAAKARGGPRFGRTSERPRSAMGVLDTDAAARRQPEGEGGEECSSSGEWSAKIRAQPRRRTGASRRSAENTTPPPEADNDGNLAHQQPAQEVRGVSIDASSSGEWDALAEVKREIDFRRTRARDFSPPVTPASELRAGSAETFKDVDVDWRTEVVDVQAQLDSLRPLSVEEAKRGGDCAEALPYTLAELCLESARVSYE